MFLVSSWKNGLASTSARPQPLPFLLFTTHYSLIIPLLEVTLWLQLLKLLNKTRVNIKLNGFISVLWILWIKEIHTNIE
jgi:hypothetical protein